MAERHSWPGIIFVNISSYIQENTMNGGGSRRCFELSVPQKIPSFCPVFHFLVKLGWVWTEWVIYTYINIYIYIYIYIYILLWLRCCRPVTRNYIYICTAQKQESGAGRAGWEYLYNKQLRTLWSDNGCLDGKQATLTIFLSF